MATPKTDLENLLQNIWLVQSISRKKQQNEQLGRVDEEQEEEDKEPRFFLGGALCIAENGTLMTVAHGVMIPDTEFEYDPIIRARRYHDTAFINATPIENVGRRFGLLLLKLDIPEEQRFPFYQFSNSIPPNIGNRVVAFVAQHGYPCNIENGTVNCSVPGDIQLPPEDEPFVSNDRYKSLGVATRDYFEPGSGAISDEEHVVNFVELNLLKYFQEEVNESMPLIQVKGFTDTTLDGLCGWPVFKVKGDELVGLLMFSTGQYQYIIPEQIIRQVSQLDRE